MRSTDPDSDTFSLRKASKDDIAYILGLRERTMKAQFVDTFGWNESDQLQMAASHIEDAEIILHHDRPVGVVKVLRQENRLVLDQIQVEPESQGKGIGTGVISALIRRARTERLPVELWVMKKAQAKRLYEKLGFALIKGAEHNCLMRFSPDTESQPKPSDVPAEAAGR
jgi:GNAT superfamily N-acetyltransferase